MMLAMSAKAADPPESSIAFSWNCTASSLDTNLVFRLYTSTNITRPLTNWQMIGSVSGLTNIAGTVRMTARFKSGPRFFVMTVSNSLGNKFVQGRIASTNQPKNKLVQ